MSLESQCQQALAQDASAKAIEFKGKTFSWGDLRSVADTVNSILDKSGVGPLDPVGFVPRNRPSAAATLLGLIAAKRTVRMIYAFQSPEGIARDIGRIKLTAVILADQDVSEDVLQVVKSQGIATVALSDTAAKISAHVVPGAETSTAPRDPDAPKIPELQILTSGTTGPPKQFSVAYDMIDKHILGVNVSYQNPEEMATLPPMLLYFPFGNISGIYSLLPAMLKGQSAVLLEKFDIELWRQYIVKYRPIRSGLPPAGVGMILSANIPKEDLSSLQALGTGAAPLDPTIQRTFEDKYEIPILLSYGATEFGGPVTAMTIDHVREFGRSKFGSVGRSFAGAQLRVRDAETDEILPPGKEGVLEVIAPRIGPDWIRTTDVVLIDEDGFVFHRGRNDGAIMRGGFKLLPETIERALVIHPDVAAASVIGLPDARLGEAPAAAVQFEPGRSLSNEELEQHLRRHVLATHLPTRYLIVDQLPRTPSLKVDRPAVKKLFLKDVGG